MKEEGRKKLKERGTEEQEESIYFCLFFSFTRSADSRLIDVRSYILHIDRMSKPRTKTPKIPL